MRAYRNRAEPFRVGYQLPAVVVHDAGGGAHGLEDYYRPDIYTAVVAFWPACASCVAEAQVWQRLDSAFRSRLQVIALADTPDLSLVDEFRSKGGMRIPLLRIDEATRRRLLAISSPTIYVVDWEGRVVFSEHGLRATSRLEAWLQSDPVDFDLVEGR